ncbi:MAG: YIP1 family protein [Saccharofermentanales bacterium]
MSNYFNISFIIIATLIILLVVLLKIIKKRRKRHNTSGHSSLTTRIGNDINEKAKFAFHVILHPFKGFWELMREKMGSFTVATIILILLIITYILRRQATGFIYNYNVIYQMNLIIQITSVAIPFLLWCVANWSITTLVEGEGSIKYIYIASAYAMIPIILLNVPMLVLSQFLTMNESSLYLLLDNISLLWTGSLLLIGIMTIHQFTLRKTVVTIFIAVITMAIMIFLFLLFIAVLSQMINFVLLIYSELSFR